MSPSISRFFFPLCRLLVILVLVPAAGCTKRPPPLVVPIPQTPDNLSLGDECFLKGDYLGASRAYERYLEEDTAGEDLDRVLFRLAVSYLFPGSPVSDPERAGELLEQLAAPERAGPFASTARFILELQAELGELKTDLASREAQIKRLTGELEALKEIDMRRTP